MSTNPDSRTTRRSLNQPLTEQLDNPDSLLRISKSAPLYHRRSVEDEGSYKTDKVLFASIPRPQPATLKPYIPPSQSPSTPIQSHSTSIQPLPGSFPDSPTPHSRVSQILSEEKRVSQILSEEKRLIDDRLAALPSQSSGSRSATMENTKTEDMDSISTNDLLRAILLTQQAGIQAANESALRISKLEEERIISARESAEKIAALEEKLLNLRLSEPSPGRPTASDDTSRSGIDLTKFKSSDGPMFKGPYRDTESFLKWFTALKIFFMVKKVVTDEDRIVLTGSYLLETNLQAFWAHNIDAFKSITWDDFKERLFTAALPSDWNDKLREKILLLRMSYNEDFKTYSTRARSVQSLMNHDKLILNDFTLATHLVLGILPELKSSIRLHNPLIEEGFDYNKFEERCEVLYDDLIIKKVIMKRSGSTYHRTTTTTPSSYQPIKNLPTTSGDDDESKKQAFIWKIKAYLDSAGLCHFCKKQCGSEYKQCTGKLSKERIIFPPGFIAPPKPANYTPPRARLAPSTAGRPTQPPAGRPITNSVAAVEFPQYDATTIAAFEEIDCELKEIKELGEDEVVQAGEEGV